MGILNKMRIILCRIILLCSIAPLCRGAVELAEGQTPYDHLLPMDSGGSPEKYDEIIETALFGMPYDRNIKYEIKGLAWRVFVTPPNGGEYVLFVYDSEAVGEMHAHKLCFARAESSLWEYYLMSRDDYDDEDEVTLSMPEVKRVQFDLDETLAKLSEKVIWESLLTVRYPSYLAPSLNAVDCSRYEFDMQIAGLGLTRGQMLCPESDFEKSLAGFVDLLASYSETESAEKRASIRSELLELRGTD